MKSAAFTALKRTKPSRPAREIVMRGLIGENDFVLNFGSGHAEHDTALFREHARFAESYDPLLGPEMPKVRGGWDVIYCGYVLNVLPPTERGVVIRTIANILRPGGRAYFAVRSDEIKGRPYEDGVITSRGTFQKSYTSTVLFRELIVAFHQTRGLRSTSSYILTEARRNR